MVETPSGAAGVGWRVRFLMSALIAYAAIVLWGTLGPAPADEVRRLGRSIGDARAAVVDRSSAPRGEVQVSDPVGFGLTAEEAGNIVLFVPFVPLVALRWPRRWWAAVPAGVAATLAIEATQLWLVDHRSPQWNDVWWNSVGVVVGFAVWAVGALAWRWLAWRRRSARASDVERAAR